MAGDWDGEVDRRRALLRQLRDLDDDLAAGKLTEEDHRRLREPIEQEAAVSLTRRSSRTATATRRRADEPDRRPGGAAGSAEPDGSGEDAEPGSDGTADPAARRPGGSGTESRGSGRGPGGSGSESPGSGSESRGSGRGPGGPGRGLGASGRGPGGRTRTGAATAGRGPRSRARLIVPAVLAVAAVAGLTALLAGAISPRGAGQTVTGSGPVAAATAPPVGPTAGPTADQADPADPSAGANSSLTPEQAAAIAAAEIDVKAHPKDVSKHLTLAHAYADGGANQLAAVEYLAIIKLDPTNAEANTALALLAFESGQNSQAKTMLDGVLQAHPDYPEALYVRGLVLFSGLHQPAAATRDLRAYLAAAPYGSYRTAAETLLALAGSTK